MPENERFEHDAEGLNSAVAPRLLAEHAITPTTRFFNRSHALPPPIDVRSWRLIVDGLVERPVTWSLDQLLRTFPHHDVDATLMCAGLRRDELLRVAPLPGELPWGSEAVSNGRWGGVRLAGLLQHAGIGDGAHFVEFTGLDTVERHGEQFGFGGSIDLAKGLSPDVLLATHLNGEVLPRRHGFPMRAVVPGWYGARSVKWLGRVTLREAPSQNYFQTHAYRVQREVRNNDPRDVSAGVPLSELPLNSVIVEPIDGAEFVAGSVTITGWAIGGAGAALADVELSTDGGVTWRAVEMDATNGHWAWAFWRCSITLEPGKHELVVRASDRAGHQQPASLREVWNVKGYSNNAWHRIGITVQ